MNRRAIATILGLAAVAAILTIAGIVVRGTRRPAATNGPTITATFYPVAYFAQRIANGVATVRSLTPEGVEPHDYEPSPQDIASVTNSTLFIYNGAGLETWVDRVLPDLAAHNVTVVEASKGINLMAGHGDEQGASDPHIWLDPVLAQAEAQNILTGFIAADPAHSDTYQRNAAALVSDLARLDSEFNAGLSGCAAHSIVTSHDAFRYLGKRYGIESVPIAGLSPDQEPSPKDLADVTDFARTNHVRYIFFETLVSPKLAQTIANEVGAQTLVADPIEGIAPERQATGENYFTVQAENLKNFRTALQCP